jgi:hypothetical protein
MLGISGLVEELLVFQEELCFMALDPQYQMARNVGGSQLFWVWH